MNGMRNFLKGKKSYLIAGSAALTAVAAWAGGEIELLPMLAVLWSSAFGLAVRAALSRLFEKIGG